MITRRQAFARAVLATAALAGLVGAEPARAADKLNVVATLPDFGSLAREIGGDKVNVTVLAKPTEDPHFVDARPSFVVSMRNADVESTNISEPMKYRLALSASGESTSRVLAAASGITSQT